MVVVTLDVSDEDLHRMKKAVTIKLLDDLQSHIASMNGFACVAGSYALNTYMLFHKSLTAGLDWGPNNMDIWVENVSIEDIWMFILQHCGKK